MSEVGTGYIVQVEISSWRGIEMSALDFSLEFYTKLYHRISFEKDELVHIKKGDRDLYYALLDTGYLGPGQLFCNIKIKDPEPRWGSNGQRPVILKRFTGKIVGGCASSHATASHAVQQNYDDGYKVDFNFLYGLPKADVAYIFYGKFIDQINSFDELTPEMLVSPDNNIISVTAGKLDKTAISNIVAGNKVLVLIPSDYNYVATKDNGIGGKVPFDTSIMGCNGEKQIAVDGVNYKIYGEFMTVSGELFIYVD